MKSYSPIDVFAGRAHGLSEPRRIGCEHEGTTAGHREDQPGLRGHSVGDAFPWRVVGRGNGAWTVEGTTGRVAYFTHDEDGLGAYRAGQAARRLKVLHPAGRIDATPGDGIANISGALETIPGRLAGRVMVIHHPSNGTTERFRVQDHDQQRAPGSRWHGSPVVVCRNLATGLMVEIPTPYLAHNQRITVTLDLEER